MAAIAQTDSVSLPRQIDIVSQGLNKTVAGILVSGYIATDLLNYGSQKFFSKKIYNGPTHEQATQAALGLMYAPGDAVGLKVTAAKTEAEKRILENSNQASNIATAFVPGLGIVKGLGATSATLKTGATVAVEATAAAKTAAATTTTVKTTAGNGIEWIAPTLSAETAEAAAKIAANRAARESAEAAAAAGTKAAGATAQAATKTELSAWQIKSFLGRETNLPARLEYLSGAGAKAESKIIKLIAEARKNGLDGGDWAAIKASRTLPQETIDRVKKVYDASIGSPIPGKNLGPAVERLKGSFAYAADYKLETAKNLTLGALKLPFTASAAALHNPKAALAIGTGGYLAYGTAANYLAAEATAADGSARDASFTESLLYAGSQTIIDVSKLSASSLLTGATLLATKIPGAGDIALDGMRGTARTLVKEMADGETNEAAAWEKAKEKLGKFLPSASVDAMGDFVKGKDIKLLTAEQRVRITDAMEAISSPRGDKAKALLNTTVAEAKQKAEQVAAQSPFTAGARRAATVVGAGAVAVADTVAEVEYAAALKKAWETTKDNPYAAVGAVAGLTVGYYTSKGDKSTMAIKMPIYAALFGFAFQMFGNAYPGAIPYIWNFIKTLGGDALEKTGLSAKFDAAMNGPAPAPKPVTAPKPVEPQDKPLAPQDMVKSGAPSGEKKIMDMFANAGNGVAHTDKPDFAPKPIDYSLVSTSFKNEPVLKL